VGFGYGNFQNCHPIITHPDDWHPCKLGSECIDFNCLDIHPPGRTNKCKFGPTCRNRHCEMLHPSNWAPPTKKSQQQQQQQQIETQLKSLNERKQERLKISLPILKSQEEFCRRLREEKVLVVKAETGSGKTTQLPQYAAEEFLEKMIICTQPRVIAAITIAKRVAQEYDGTSIGNSVGYQVGGGNKIPGKKILFMTDAALVQLAQKDPLLKNVAVLIIDEAHERSLNTDIVLGIAKIIRDKRDDFHVVISSATIDETIFLKFFNLSQPSLSVPGRVFPVTLEYEPPPKNGKYLEDFYVSKLLQVLSEKQGHALIFFSGQNELESAMKKFRSKAPSNYIALPLFASLPPEEQEKVMNFDDGKDQNLRMIVFCTNVAETSLTVPKVKIVIDTGFAKESRFDHVRRIGVLEQIRIAKSSADQRKGRAGRTSEGYCLRLYGEEELTRPSIQPEILRSSLDMIVLILKRLEINPLSFPFISSPETELLEASVQLLKRLECLDHKEELTERGKLFSDLPFDPRLSNFVLTAHQKYQKLELASTIAAILTAPGKIFLMGGANKDAKEEAQRRIALKASQHHSDLLNHYSIFKEWETQGLPNGNCCQTCHQKISKKGSCKKCCVKFAVQEGLNNKILEIIQQTRRQVTKIIHQHSLSKNDKRSKKNKEDQEDQEDDDDEDDDEDEDEDREKKEGNQQKKIFFDQNDELVVAYCLIDGFPEQIGQALVPSSPSEGIRITHSDVAAIITRSSCALQRVDSNPPEFYIAMSVTFHPSGFYGAENLHPVKGPCANLVRERDQGKLFNMKLVFEQHNIGKYIFDCFKREMDTLRKSREKKDQWIKWVKSVYSPQSSTLKVYAPDHIQFAQNELQSILGTELHRALTYEITPRTTLANVSLTCVAGMKIKDITPIENLTYTIRKPPSKTKKDFEKWLKDKIQLDSTNYRWFDLKKIPNSELALIAFKSKEDTKYVERIRKQLILLNHDDQDPATLIEEKSPPSIQGCKYILTVTKPTTEQNLTQNLEGLGYSMFHLKLIREKTEYVLKVKNFREEEKSFRELFKEADTIFFQKTNDVCRATLFFDSFELREEAERTIIYQYDSRIKRGMTEIDLNIKKETKYSSTYCLIFKNLKEAEKFYGSSVPNIDKKSLNATLDVKHPELFPMVDYLNTLQQLFQKVTITEKTIKKEKYKKPGQNFHENITTYNFDGPPILVSKAIKKLKEATLSRTLRMSTPHLSSFYTELHRNGVLVDLAKTLGLRIYTQESYNKCKSVEIHGPHVSQGEFLRKIFEYSDEFDKRYSVLILDSTMMTLFNSKAAGNSKLVELQKKHPHVSFTISRELSGIEILVSRNHTTPLSDYKELILKLLEELGCKQQPQSLKCSYCNQETFNSFSICGHPFCKSCFSSHCTSQFTGPITCPQKECQSPISSKDFERYLKEEDLEILVKNSLQYFLLQSKVNYRICPNDDCKEVVEWSNDYLLCPECEKGFCFQCQTSDPYHENISCSDYQKKRQEIENFFKNMSYEMKKIAIEAKMFVESNWPIDLPKITDISVNNAINTIANSYIMFKDGIELFGGAQSFTDKKDYFFAWHGTAEHAIAPICRDGWDPKRRSGQAYGPGEYFGWTASVSRGYCRSDTRMILAVIIRGVHVHNVPGFCYVVNNPIDKTFAYCLPLLVVTFGSNKTPPKFLDCEQLGSNLESLENNNDISWKSPFRWYWQEDDGNYFPYKDDVNEMIERNYEVFEEFQTPPIIRYSNDIPQTYKISFTQKIQTSAWGKRRNIKREAVNIEIQNHLWQYYDENDTWKTFDSLVQSTIEISFLSYINESGPSSIEVQPPGRPEMYQIDFITGQQKNSQSQKSRRIRRIKKC